MTYRILVSNDDGIDAPGLLTLLNRLAAEKDFELRVVAPAENQSAVGHGVTLRNSIYVQERKVTVDGGHVDGFVVQGTPADCLILAIRALAPTFKPDLVIAGINSGRNVSHSIFYSGTVAAALEGAILGCRAMALSLSEPEEFPPGATHAEPRNWPFEMAAEFSIPIIRAALERPLSQISVVNVNIPNLPRDQIKGTRLTHQGQSGFEDQFVEEEPIDHRRKFRLTGRFVYRSGSLDDDAVALKEGWITITPLALSLYSAPLAEEIARWKLP